jgi:hypothetical protein
MRYPLSTVWTEVRRLGWWFAWRLVIEGRWSMHGVELPAPRFGQLMQQALARREPGLLLLARWGRWGTAVALVAGWVGVRWLTGWLSRHGIQCGCSARQSALDATGITVITRLRAWLARWRTPRR